eukprot:TRINITY_DN73598_c0_g1_i1.p1 TRINITY_DN73598_c0_g1~~TRINITY_DN73598_c0_g1_i1.p1  ORF type:complete len:221 (-),score=46.00 TRINITY_DN73598_c0_g1_i1:55-717(-)
MASATSNVNETFRRAEKLKREVDQILEGMAASQVKQGGSDVATQQRLSCLASDLQSAARQVKEEVAAIPERSRGTWDRKAMRLDEDVVAILGAVDKQLGQFYKVRKEEEDRQKLFGDRSKKTDGDDDMAMARENKALRDSHNALDEVIAQGNSILGNLVGQNKMLKNARKKLLDAANVMGISQSLVNVIDRRNTGDKWLVYGGMCFILFLLFSLFYLLRF